MCYLPRMASRKQLVEGRLGTELHQAMERSGMTREELAKKSGVGVATISRILRGAWRARRVLPALEQALGMPEDALHIAERIDAKELTPSGHPKRPALAEPDEGEPDSEEED